MAPKARITKHGVVTEPEGNIAQADENLIDFSDDNKPRHKALQRTQTDDQSMPPANGTAPVTAPDSRRDSALRRSSSLASVSKDGQPKPANKDHFRNLGPSNLASRPRQTRYNTVKIKPGGGTLAENLAKASVEAPSGSPLAMSSVTPAPHGGAGTGLLSSAGKDASDGVLAVQQGYGTMGSGSTPPKSSSGGGGKNSSGGPSAASHAHPAATIPEEPSWKSHDQASDSESTIGSLRRRSEAGPKSVSPSQRRGTARSGSITETHVDLDGIRKVVLETTSSSEEAAAVREQQQQQQLDDGGGVGLSQRAVANGLEDEDEGEGEGEGEGKGKQAGSGRKKRRRRKRKPAAAAAAAANTDENELLVSSERGGE